MKKRTLFVLLILLVLLLGSVAGVVVGKYITTVTRQQEFTVQVKLAASLEVQEHKAERNPNGSYTLDESTTVAANRYVLIPGLDVPKDPYVVIEGKTEIPAYLYLTVTDEFANGAVTYTLADCWELVAETSQSSTYVYSSQGEAVKLTNQAGALITIPVLKDEHMYVSHTLLGQGVQEGALVFSARLTEVLEN